MLANDKGSQVGWGFLPNVSGTIVDRDVLSDQIRGIGVKKVKTRKIASDAKPLIEYGSLRNSYLELLKISTMTFIFLMSVISLYGQIKYRPKLEEGIFIYVYPFKTIFEVGDYSRSETIIMVLGIAIPVLFGAIESLVKADNHDRNYTEYRKGLLRLLAALAGAVPICMLLLVIETVKGLIPAIVALVLFIVLVVLMHMTALAVKHSGNLVEDMLESKRNDLNFVNFSLQRVSDFNDVKFYRLVIAYLAVCTLHFCYFVLVGQLPPLFALIFVLCAGVVSLVLGIAAGRFNKLGSRYDRWSTGFMTVFILTVFLRIPFLVAKDEFWSANVVAQLLFFGFYGWSAISLSSSVRLFKGTPTAYGAGLWMLRASLVKKSRVLTAEVHRLEAEFSRAEGRSSRSLRKFIARLLSWDN